MADPARVLTNIFNQLCLTNTTCLLSLKTPLITRGPHGGSRCFPSSENVKNKKSHEVFLFWGLKVNFPHCFATVVDSLWIMTSSVLSSAAQCAVYGSWLLVCFIVLFQCRSKAMWATLQVVSVWWRPILDQNTPSTSGSIPLHSLNSKHKTLPSRCWQEIGTWVTFHAHLHFKYRFQQKGIDHEISHEAGEKFLDIKV